EDVLRGRPVAAIPANVLRKSGPTQINHLVAQLTAHHVPVNLGHLFAGRTTNRVEWESDFTPQPLSRCDEGEKAEGRKSEMGSPAMVMHEYMDTMEKFLDVQREVMEAFLSGHTAPHIIAQLENFLPADLPFPDFTLTKAPTLDESATRLALVGHV